MVSTGCQPALIVIQGWAPPKNEVELILIIISPRETDGGKVEKKLKRIKKIFFKYIIVLLLHNRCITYTIIISKH